MASLSGLGPRFPVALTAAIAGFFVITLDAVILNVALPAIGEDLRTGISGIQWVVDGYTLSFAAFLLWSGALTDRIGARNVFTIGIAIFVAASIACGAAPGIGWLVAARLLQGAAAALMMPSSMALIGQAYTEQRSRARAIGWWAMGGAVASTSGPVLGGLFTLVSWRLIFFVNVPVGALALAHALRLAPSARRHVPFDWIGQATAVLSMAALTYGAIEVGVVGIAAPGVLLSFAVAAMAALAFVARQRTARHPMVPLELLRHRNVSASVAVGFTFVAGYYGLPFVMSIFLQQGRDLTAFETGCLFLPMMLSGGILLPASAPVVERFGIRAVVPAGLIVMATGLVLVAGAASWPLWAIALSMLIVGAAGPFIIPPTTAVLLSSLPDTRAGTASGVFNTSRQIGGALAVAVFGSLLDSQVGLLDGARTSLLVAAAVALAAGLVALRLAPVPEQGGGARLEDLAA